MRQTLQRPQPERGRAHPLGLVPDAAHYGIDWVWDDAGIAGDPLSHLLRAGIRGIQGGVVSKQKDATPLSAFCSSPSCVGSAMLP